MLLPCGKNLWRAQTKSEWVKEYTAQSNLQSKRNEQRPTFGDLLQHDSELNHSDNSLEYWLGQVDDFGTLIIASANLSEGVE
jgi:hypothetical protein